MKRFRPLLFATPFVFACSSFVHAAVTTPSGFVTISVKAGSFSAPPTHFIGFGLSKPAVFQRTISAVTTAPGGSGTVTQLNFDTNSFAAGNYGSTGNEPTHYAEIIDGTAAGQCSPVSNTLANVAVLSDLLPSFSGTASARIRPLWTVEEVFGAQNSAGFLAGVDSTVADVIRIRPAKAAPIEIFYKTGSNRWETVAGVPANTLRIPADAGLEVVRRGSNDLSFPLVGEVKTGQTVVRVAGGSSDIFTFHQNVYPLPAKRLKDLGLYTGDPATGVKAGSSATTADVVTIQDPATGVLNQFFMDSVSGRWKTGFTDASLVQIPDNASIAITRRNGAAFEWTLPQPTMALEETPLPLTLVAAASRKTHGATGAWDVNLPLTGTAVGVEPRTGGGTNAATVVFTFDGASAENPLNAGTAVVSAGAGSVQSTTFNGKEMVVNLTGVTNLQTTTITVSNVAAQNGQAFATGVAKVGVLLADVDYNKSVSASDLGRVKVNSSQAVVLGNFRADVDANGSVTASDVGRVKINSSFVLP